MADLLIKRIHPDLTKDDLVDADLLCYYIGSLIDIYWFPLTYVYKLNDQFKLTDRLLSQRHFEKVKVLFDVSSPNELIVKLKQLREKKKDSYNLGYPNSRGITPIYRLIHEETIATVR